MLPLGGCRVGGCGGEKTGGRAGQVGPSRILDVGYETKKTLIPWCGGASSATRSRALAQPRNAQPIIRPMIEVHESPETAGFPRAARGENFLIAPSLGQNP